MRNKLKRWKGWTESVRKKNAKLGLKWNEQVVCKAKKVRYFELTRMYGNLTMTKQINCTKRLGINTMGKLKC